MVCQIPFFSPAVKALKNGVMLAEVFGQIGPGRHEGGSAIGLGAVPDDIGKVGVGTLLPVSISIKFEGAGAERTWPDHVVRHAGAVALTLCTMTRRAQRTVQLCNISHHRRG